jgi:hypothetical protein
MLWPECELLDFETNPNTAGTLQPIEPGCREQDALASRIFVRDAFCPCLLVKLEYF